ncbi:hypothetical protein KDA_48000 [Dictyobacter alpinus]|uniref:Calcineurin-like phosphoesterase domain-containing protein n=1 Tax=Dictyobacter alpinus TaxID=2014873 RepID=A0A402BDB9_9CHLR|nr:metallophosphoesterase [Dictyobacter alpinus]GCE29316.1 hypothetical protein KDA_48000 [Dictyobacter alpinus]
MQQVEQSSFTPRLIPLSWEDGRLVPQIRPAASGEKAARITILHTNDLHASVDGRPDENGQQRGGLARVATTVRLARESGPTLVFDLGDIVFGDGTWWNIQGIEPVATLRARAGCDLGTIGNHDLEHGVAGLRELLKGGYPIVSANLCVEDQIYPAYLIEIAGWRIGVTGLTTRSTTDLIPSRILHGITLSDPGEAAARVVSALEPLVDSIVLLSHLGFYQSGPGDPELAMRLAGSKVSLILGSHTHAALDPPCVMHGITICNAGAYGANVGEVILSHHERQPVNVQARLIPQDETVPADASWLAARVALARTFKPFHETSFALPSLPQPANLSSGPERDRTQEWILLARSLRMTGNVPASAIVMVPLLYALGHLPERERVTLAEIMTIYPSIEHLVKVELSGNVLKDLIVRQESLLYYQQARPLLLADESELLPVQVEEQRLYTIVTSELACEGGLDWGINLTASSKSLNISCSQVVRAYLTSYQERL